MNKFYVTTPIYYVNAKPHIGHLYTTIAADVLARWHRSRGDSVLFSTGTDENSQKNVEAAEKQGTPVQEYVDAMAAVWETTFKQLGLSYDVFIRTTAPEHEVAVKALLTKITEQGDIYLGDYEGYYCVGCEAFVAEKDLIDGKCPIHNTVPQKIKEKNYFFKLSKYRDQLLALFAQNPDFVQPESVKNKVIDYLTNDLADISISRASQEWGIRLPQDPTHAVYVWFDALVNYLTAAGYPARAGKTPEGVRNPGDKVPDPLPGVKEARDFAQYWPADLHLIGKDIIKFHAAIWPAMLISAGLPVPKKIFAHGFFTIDGQKISKSLGNAIDPLELIKEYPIDAIRYFLLRDIPFGNDGDFSHERLRGRYNADLANGLGNLVSRTLTMIEQFAPNLHPRGVNKDDSPGVEVGLATVNAHLESLAFDKALQAIWDVIAWADELIEKTKPWELAKKSPPNKGEIEEVLSQLFQALVGINEALEPFMPETHTKLTQLLAARPLKKPTEPLFARKG